MRVLLDECVDPRVSQFFSDSIYVRHVKDMGWLGTKNGELVRLASTEFEVLFTIDRNMRFQTNLSGIDLAVVVAEGHFRTIEAFRTAIIAFEARISEFSPSQFHLINIG